LRDIFRGPVRPPSFSFPCSILLLAASLALGQPASRPAPDPRVRVVTWRDVQPIVDRSRDLLPKALLDVSEAQRARSWVTWVAEQKARTASRIRQGEDDSLINLLLFGTSFTAQPRVTVALLTDLDRRWREGDRTAHVTLTSAYQTRADDFIAAAARPAKSDRWRFVRTVLERHGFNLATASGRKAARAHVLAEVVRVRQEAAGLARALEEARANPDAAGSTAERSRLFRTRGLAPDSSVLTQFAIERALCSLKADATLAASRPMRVAVVGPGLDFADKQEGFDFYEPQTLQPFTTIDSLLRCGLAASVAELQLTTIDVSERVNGHLRGAIARASTSGAAYTLVLPRDMALALFEPAVDYWQRAGDQIGTSFSVAVPDSVGAVAARGVRVRSGVVSRIRPVDANIVFDRVEPSREARFDLAIITNVLIYYDVFEQTLALASIASMLRPGGMLLTNDAVPDIAEVPLRPAGHVTVPFSDRTGDGERVFAFRRD
jgi:hypothetical protein